MNFSDFIEKYGQTELTINPIDVVNDKITFAVDGHTQNSGGNIDYFYFIIVGDFKIHLLRDEEGWRLNYAITTFEISKINDEKNIYAIQEYLGAYIEFSVDNCKIEELTFDTFQKRIKKSKHTTNNKRL